MFTRLVSLLMLCILLAAATSCASAEQAAQDAIRISAVYTEQNDQPVILVVTNLTKNELTWYHLKLPISRVTTAAGVDVPPRGQFRRVNWVRESFTLQAGGEHSIPLNPVTYYPLIPGEAYFITVRLLPRGDGRIVSCTFPYVMPAVLPMFTSEWSQPVDGLRARLRLQLEEIGRFAVFAELQNMTAQPIDITNQPTVSLEIRGGSDYHAIDKVTLPMSGPVPHPQLATVPAGAILTVRIDMTTVGIQRETTLLAVGGHCWQLNPDTYYLGVTLSVENGEGWKGRITFLPGLNIAVPNRMASGVDAP